ncbi:MAG: ABC transporter permease subunit [Pseudomonadota bacterium]
MLELFRNRKFRETFFQALAVSVVAVVLIAMVVNARNALEVQGLTAGFGFLERSTGWDFSFSVLPYSISDTYQRTLWIGLLNTLLLGFLGISLATVFGVIVGLVRTSNNYLLSLLGTVYVEIFRNIPIILQGIFWYAVLSNLPRPRQAMVLGDSIFLSGRGLYFPVLNVELSAVFVMLAIVIAWFITLAWLRNRMRRSLTFERIKLSGWIALPLLLIAIGYIARIPETALVDTPILKGLNFRGGMRIPPELSALVLAIALYGGAYIGEVMRAGLQSVPRGQIEAGFVNGLSKFQIFWYVRLPLAIRLILPSLTNQYVQLMKATTIGIAVGFSDFFMIVSTSINQGGQTLELLLILVLGFLAINLSIAYVMNTINRRIALKGYEVKD